MDNHSKRKPFLNQVALTAKSGLFSVARLSFSVLALFVLYPVWLALKEISGPSARRRFADPFEKSLSYDSVTGGEEPVLTDAIRRTRWSVWLIRALVVALLIGLFPFGLWSPPANAHGNTALTLTPETATNAAGTSHTVVATLTMNQHSPAGRVVTFTATGTGVETPSFDTETTDANGRATFTFRSTRTGTSNVTAAVSFSEEGQVHSASDTATKNWHHGPPATVTVTPTTMENPVGTSHTITANATDVHKNPISFHTATISVTGAGATEATRTTDASGTVTFTFSSDDPGTSKITVTVSSDNQHASGSSGTASGTATKVWTEAAGEPDSITLEPKHETNTVGATHTVTATVRDSGETPVPGVVVTFTVGGTGFETPTFGTDTTDENGEATFSFTSTKTGDSHITATAREESCDLIPILLICVPGSEVEAIQDTATKTWTADEAFSIVLTQGSPTNEVGEDHTVTATVRDKHRNFVKDGTDVIFTVTGVGATEGVRDTTGGEATFTFTSRQSGQSTITARSGDATSMNTLNKTWTPGPASTITLSQGRSTNQVGQPHTVTATIMDEDGNVVDTTHTVTFTVTGAGATQAVTTTNGGRASFTFTSDSPGVSSITAVASGVSGESNRLNKTWTAEQVDEEPELEEPGPEDGSGPDAASWQSNRIDVVVRGTNDQIYHRWWDGTAWHGYESLGGEATTDPSTVSWGPNRLDIFVRGTDNALWHRWYENGTWYGWESLGGVLTSAPDVSSWSTNRLDVFVRGTDGQLYHRWWDGSTWQGWESLGGLLTSGPSAVSWDDNRIDVFVRGTDNALWHRWWDGISWQGYESLGGVLTSDPDVSSWGPNRLDIFVRGTDNQMWHRWYDGANGWHGYAPRGGVLTGPPGAVSWGFNRIDVFVRGTDQALWHTWWNGTAWEGYESLGGQLQ